MALFRSTSTSTSKQGRYDRLLDETTNEYAPDDQDRAVLKRVTSVPGRMLFGSSSKKPNPEQDSPKNNSKTKQNEKKKSSKSSHPLFSLFEGKSKKKMTANPDFSRYIEYMKEGGLWNKDTDSPPI